MRAVIQSIRTIAVQIYQELCLVYGPTLMNEGKIKQWCPDVISSRTNVHHEECGNTQKMNLLIFCQFSIPQIMI